MANPSHDKSHDMNQPKDMQQGDDNRRPQEQFPSSGSGARRPDASQDKKQRPSEQPQREQAERDGSMDTTKDDRGQAASGRSNKSSGKSGKSSMDRNDSSGSKSSQRE